ncbi:MAG: PHA/PHB synthase family protein [Bacteroidia bacterium]
MENEENFSLQELMNCMTIVSERTTKIYLKNFSSYHHDLRDMSLTYSSLVTKMLVNPKEMFKMYNSNLEFLKAQQEIWQKIFMGSNESETTAVIEPKEGDKRFTDSEWTSNPFFNFIKQNYLLAERLSEQIIGDVEIDEKCRKKLGFYVGQYMDAFSPTNFLFTNPEAMKLATETKGNSLWDGLNNLMKDLEKGKISQTDESAFEVGKNLAITPGNVVYENEIMQVIQYTPVTKKVFEVPLVMIPSWINKYYVLDLEPKKSLIKFLVAQGFTVFVISWCNPKAGMGYLTFDDYVGKGAIKAIEIAQNITGAKKVNTLGYCMGGTLLSVAASVLASKAKDNPINSITFLASMVDFSDIGPMGDVINESLIQKLERGELLHDGLMDGADMETAFNLLQPNNLIWNYVIGNYLEGKKPTAFDVLYWTNDNTNLPADMYKYYMRNMVFENKLSRRNALRICDTIIDIGKIDVPVFVIGFEQDIISPAVTVFTTTELVKGSVEFLLGESGHVMGAINTPSKNKYGYYLNGKLGSGFEEWKRTAKYVEGSWWTPWSEKLIKVSGKEIVAPAKAGNQTYKTIEPAPGSYIKETGNAMSSATVTKPVSKPEKVVQKMLA